MAKVEGSNPFIRFAEQPAGRAIYARSGGRDPDGRFDEKTGEVNQARRI
jgi:hypothetical protein